MTGEVTGTPVWVTGFGCRPHHGALHTDKGGRAGVRKPPGKETAGDWAPLSAGAMEFWLAGTVQRGSGREAWVSIIEGRQRRVGALRASIEEMVGRMCASWHGKTG